MADGFGPAHRLSREQDRLLDRLHIDRSGEQPEFLVRRLLCHAVRRRGCVARHGATGGGISQQFREPICQAFLPRSTQHELGGARGIPDVSWNPDPNTPVEIYISDPGDHRSLTGSRRWCPRTGWFRRSRRRAARTPGSSPSGLDRRRVFLQVGGGGVAGACDGRHAHRRSAGITPVEVGDDPFAGLVEQPVLSRPQLLGVTLPGPARS
jgi:hypothetical protein